MQKLKSSLILWMSALRNFLYGPHLSVAGEIAPQWELINPSGVIEVTFFKTPPRLSSLDGKTIVLRWNEKHNGDNFLNRIAELVKKNVSSAKVIKLYEIDKSTVGISGSAKESVRIAEVIKGLKADIVIAAQAD
jgi:hypothetical protein